ncbi:MAG: HEPN domain-containing protein [Planctomycetes bacterium]|nr:HEPN domain-containing protein [Planctomycetota bacterium]
MNKAVAAEWARALRSLQTAQHDLAVGDPDASASRAYYAVFHAVTAFFLFEGREFTKHEALDAAVHRDLVKPGRVSRDFGASFTRLRSLRMLGDYGGEERVTGSMASESIERARLMFDELRKLSGGALE